MKQTTPLAAPSWSLRVPLPQDSLPESHVAPDFRLEPHGTGGTRATVLLRSATAI